MNQGRALKIEPLDLEATWASPPARIDFVLPGLARGTVGNVVATGGTGKTFLMLATALAVGVGRDVGEIWGSDPTQGAVAFLSIEDPEPELRRRLWVLRGLLSADEQQSARASVHVLPGAGKRLALAQLAGKGGGDLKTTPWFEAFSRQVIDLRPRLIVVDTLNRLLNGVSENDGSVMGWVVSQLEELARVADCAVVLCHHVSKAALGSGNAGEAHAARGSSVIADNARWQVNLSVPAKDGPYKDLVADMEDEERRRHVRLEFSKLNYGPPLEGRWLHRGEGGMLRFKAMEPVARPRSRGRSKRSQSNDNDLKVPLVG